jgi:hypothetical protein
MFLWLMLKGQETKHCKAFDHDAWSDVLMGEEPYMVQLPRQNQRELEQ